MLELQKFQFLEACKNFSPADERRKNETLQNNLNKILTNLLCTYFFLNFNFDQNGSQMKPQLRKSSVLIETIKYQNVIVSLNI